MILCNLHMVPVVLEEKGRIDSETSPVGREGGSHDDAVCHHCLQGYV